MHLVRVSELEPGLVLAKAVTNARGAVLCPAGLKLTAETIQRLDKAGVESVAVEGGEVGGERIRHRLDALETRFAGINDPLMLEIRATIESRLSRMLSDAGV